MLVRTVYVGGGTPHGDRLADQALTLSYQSRPKDVFLEFTAVEAAGLTAFKENWIC